MLDQGRRQPLRGWVLFDGECSYCIHLATLGAGSLRRRGFNLAPLQNPRVGPRLGLRQGEPLSEMKVLTGEGRIYGGAAALVYLADFIWWAWPLLALARLPFGMALLDRAYKVMEGTLHCRNQSCGVPSPPHWPGFLLLPLLVLATLAIEPRLPTWGFMWAMVAAIALGAKWLTWWEAKRQGARSSPARSLAYLLAWPGMEAEAFLDLEKRPPQSPRREWSWAVAKTGFGGLLLWGLARLAPTGARGELVAGWLGMVGLIYLLHLGGAHLLALFWQHRGVRAHPIMDRPASSASLGDFWGRRWNLAYHTLSHNFLYRPLRRRGLSVATASMGAWLISGVAHELVISVPAGAGYGLPTLYFLLQGLGLLLERSPAGQRLGLGRGLRGRLFGWLVILGPLYWLFHPPFVRNVILPFMEAIGAI